MRAYSPGGGPIALSSMPLWGVSGPHSVPGPQAASTSSAHYCLQAYPLLLYYQALLEIATKASFIYFFLFEASTISGFAQEALKYS